MTQQLQQIVNDLMTRYQNVAKEIAGFRETRDDTEMKSKYAELEQLAKQLEALGVDVKKQVNPPFAFSVRGGA